MRTESSGQSHSNCDGWVYVGDGLVKNTDGTQEWGPRFHQCGTCEVLGLKNGDVSLIQRNDLSVLGVNPSVPNLSL